MFNKKLFFLILRWLRYVLEACILLFGLVLFRILPLDIASCVGGYIARLIGPRMRADRIAENNLKLALPALSGAERSAILVNMWDNLGRGIGEYPHLPTSRFAQRVNIEGKEHIAALTASGQGGLFISGHFANWEIGPLSAALSERPMVVIYRAFNNPFSEWLLRCIREKYSLSLYSKGTIGAKETIKALKEGHIVAMLLDQKMNDGSPVPFFGQPAMTTTAAIAIATKLQVPVLPVRMMRLKGARFKVVIHPPQLYDAQTNPVEAMTGINKLFETWISEYPAQWLWVHNRWGKSK